MIGTLKFLVERKFFEMFSFLGETLGISSRRIRLFFIYTTFVTVGSPFIVVIMIVDFWKYLFRLFQKPKGNGIWDL